MTAPRHHGSPAEEYRAALEGAAIVDRSFRGRLLVSGRAPVQMIQGIITNSVPPLPSEAESGVLRGEARYSAVLTRKGRMVTDLRVLRAGPREEDGLLLDVPQPGMEPALAHFRMFLPPRMARLTDLSEALSMITVVGPRAAELLSLEALGLRVEAETLEGMAEDDWVGVGGGLVDASQEPPVGEGTAVLRSGDVAAPAFDVLGPADTIRALRSGLEELGGVPMGRGGWEVLRLEAGRPAFGSELGEDTIPVEAGIHDRAIDYGKGCYTGQEVIIRIRDRGRVNRHLRGLLLGDGPTPAAGTELFHGEGDRPVGSVASAADSPRVGGGIALAWVRREVEPGGMVAVGSPGGRPAEVRELRHGWAFADG